MRIRHALLLNVTLPWGGAYCCCCCSELILISWRIPKCTMKEFVFYYDVICPYAYLASRLIEGIAEKAGARVRWRPVLLGATLQFLFQF